MQNSSSPQVVGFYSQPYNEIVKPDQIWPVSKYFLRRWTPYLNPTRFWTVIAARQLAYRMGNKHRFECYDSLLYEEACTSRANFYRIKAELDQADSPISLFISREPLKYQRQGEVTRPGPTVYYVRLDDVLTPGDASHLTTWLQAQQPDKGPEAIIELLEHAATLPSSELLAPSLTPYLADLPAKFQAVTVADVIGRVFGSKIAKEEGVRKAADALHTKLTASVFIGTQYFRKYWLNILGAGPALLITYLRSYCYQNEESGEVRDRVTFTRPELADALGIDRATLFRWLKKIDKKTPAKQPFYPFLELIDTQKTAANEVEATYRIQLHEPLTAKHLTLYGGRTKDYALQPELQNETHPEPSNDEAASQNETHTQGEIEGSGMQNETHTRGESTSSALQNEIHDGGKNREPALQNETDAGPSIAKLDSHPGSILQNETTSVAKWDAYKHLNTLVKTLERKEVSTFAAAAAAHPDLLPFWKLENNQAAQSFAQAAVVDFEGFCQAVNVQGRRSRNLVARSGLTLEQVVAWYLYVLTQNGIAQDMRPGYIVNRAREKEAPPVGFQQLASLSWELWRCYACLLDLPLLYRDCLQNAPGYQEWMVQYGQSQSRELPFGVGEGVYEFMAFITDGEQPNTAETTPRLVTPVPAAHGQTFILTPATDAARVSWRMTLLELELQMTKATFNTWLKDAHLLGRDENVYVIGVHNEYAQDWLTRRLRDTIQRTFAVIIQEQVELRFVVWDAETDSVNPAS